MSEVEGRGCAKRDKYYNGLFPIRETLESKITSLKKEVARLKALEVELLVHPDKQLSMTDPDSRSLRLRGSGIVGYNVQSEVDVENHLIVAHEVTMNNTDRSQLFSMSNQAKKEMRFASNRCTSRSWLLQR